MTNQILLLLFTIPAAVGLLLLRVMRSDRRHQFVQQRLHALTAGNGGSESSEQPSLVRGARRTTCPMVFEFPHKLCAKFDAALESTGKSIGLLHLIGTGIIAAALAIPFTSRILLLNPGIVMLSG